MPYRLVNYTQMTTYTTQTQTIHIELFCLVTHLIRITLFFWDRCITTTAEVTLITLTTCACLTHFDLFHCILTIRTFNHLSNITWIDYSPLPLHRIMREYIDYYNRQRPCQGISQKTPIPFPSLHDGRIQCQNVLGGIIHSYYREAG
jgi:hypothetical protein